MKGSLPNFTLPKRNFFYYYYGSELLASWICISRDHPDHQIHCPSNQNWWQACSPEVLARHHTVYETPQGVAAFCRKKSGVDQMDWEFVWPSLCLFTRHHHSLIFTSIRSSEIALSPLFRWGVRSSGRLRRVPQVTELMNSNCGLWTHHPYWPQGLGSQPLWFMFSNDYLKKKIKRVDTT